MKTRRELMTGPLIFFCLITLGSSQPELHYDSENISYTSGTFPEYLADPLFYDGYFPLLFSIQVPKHMESAMKIMWQHATVCNATDSRYDGKLCPVVHHLHKVVANLSADMGFWKELVQEGEGETDKKEIKLNCKEISKHFKSTFTSREDLDNYLLKIERCLNLPPSSSAAIPIVKSTQGWIIDKQIYYTMVDRFYSEFYRSLPGTGGIDWVVTLNSYVSLQSVLLSNNYMESNRLHNAWIQCQQGKIPESFITRKKLEETLENNRQKVSQGMRMDYLIKDAKNFLQYYTLPIADCTFTDTDKLIVRILIPLKERENYVKLLKVRTVPFLKSSTSLCKIPVQDLYLLEGSSGLLFHPPKNCREGQLCLKSELESFSPTDACTSAILSGNESSASDPHQACPLTCFPIDPKTLPLFYRVGPSTFYALGTEAHNIFIQCGGQPLEKLGLREKGALELELGCDCQISYRSLVLRPDYGKCGESLKVKVRHVLPLQWKKLNETFVKDMEKFRYDSQTEEAEKLSAASNSRECLEAGGGVLQFAFLWLFIFTLFVSNFILLYQVYFLIKWKKLQMYKDTRIVYSVPPSPQFPNKF